MTISNFVIDSVLWQFLGYCDELFLSCISTILVVTSGPWLCTSAATARSRAAGHAPGTAPWQRRRARRPRQRWRRCRRRRRSQPCSWSRRRRCVTSRSWACTATCTLCGVLLQRPPQERCRRQLVLVMMMRTRSELWTALEMADLTRIALESWWRVQNKHLLISIISDRILASSLPPS